MTQYEYKLVDDPSPLRVLAELEALGAQGWQYAGLLEDKAGVLVMREKPSEISYRATPDWDMNQSSAIPYKAATRRDDPEWLTHDRERGEWLPSK